MDRFSPWILAALLLLPGTALPASADPAADAWVARYNGPSNGIDVGRRLAVDAGGNVCVTGRSEGVGTLMDYATVKYGPDGALLWEARYDGPGNGNDQPNHLAVDARGNVYVTGMSQGAGTGDDYATVKYGPDGTRLWAARYDGTGNGVDAPIFVAVDAAGNVYVTGSSEGVGSRFDVATVKYDSEGFELWAARYDGTAHRDDWANSLAVDPEGCLIVTAMSTGAGSGGDTVTLKYDPGGELLWEDRYNGPVNGYDEPDWMGVDGAGNVYVTGKSDGGATGDDLVTVKYDPEGNRLWLDRYTGSGASHERDAFLALDGAGRAHVSCSTGVYPLYDFLTVKYDPDGTRLWTARYEGRTGGNNAPSFVGVDGAGNVYVTGKSGAWPLTDYATVKYDPDGNRLWDALYNGPAGSEDEPDHMAVDAAGNVYVTGKSAGVGTDLDFATLKNPHRVCFDRDGDGYDGNPSPACCAALPWDCRDSSPESYPGSAENCFNRLDDNCNGLRDREDGECAPLWEELAHLTSETADADRDGLRDLEELELWYYQVGIRDPETLEENILVRDDVDGDGIPDGLEVLYGTDPSVRNDPPEALAGTLPDWAVDGDGDGLINGLEAAVYRTNPLVDDTDGDGFGDAAEVGKGSDPCRAASIPEYDAVIVGRVETTLEPGASPVGVNGVEVVLRADRGAAPLDRVVTGPLFGRDGSFIFGIENLGGPAAFLVDITSLPGRFHALTDLPRQVEAAPYASGGAVEVVLEVAGFVDRDGDGVPEEVEQAYGTLDASRDTDGDGMPDGFEILHNPGREAGLCCDPQDPGDARLDADRDGTANIDEMGRSNPNDPANIPLCDTGEAPESPSSASLLKVQVNSEYASPAGISIQAPSLIPGTLTGRVSCALSGAGLTGAAVFFLRGTGCPREAPCETVSETVSQENGIFWAILPGGDYWVQVCRSGYYPGEAAVQVGSGATAEFSQVVLAPRDPAGISPDAWDLFQGGGQAAGVLRPAARTLARGAAWRQADGTYSRTLFIPLPLQNWGDDTEAGLEAVGSGDGGTEDAAGPILSGRYRLDVFAEAAAGTSVSRVEPEVVSRSYVELESRPGDAVGLDGGGGWDTPDGRVTAEDAGHALAVAVGKAGTGYARSLDVLPDPVVRHDAGGRPVYTRDRRVTLEDAYAVIREAAGSLAPPLPETFQAMKTARALPFELEDTSVVIFFDASGRIVDRTTVQGTAEFEFSSFPVDSAGTAFHIHAYDTVTGDVVVPWLAPVPLSFRFWLGEGEAEGAVGTVVYAGEVEGLPRFSFLLDNFFVNVDYRIDGEPILIHPHNPWDIQGSFSGGEYEGDPVAMQTGFFGFQDLYCVILLNFRSVPEGGVE